MIKFFTLLMFLISTTCYSQSGTWTWMAGDTLKNNTPNYGVKGVSSAFNSPGGRVGSVTWTDNSGDFWLFGGQKFTSSQDGYLNDLWKFSTATQQWTWISGDTTIKVPGAFGVKGTESATAMPGNRTYGIGWVDSVGNLWLYGGQGYTSTGPGLLDDLWRFNIVTNNWTWMNGSGTLNKLPFHGINRVSSPGNSPGGRTFAVGWTDSSKNFWLFSGQIAKGSYGYTNSLWKYNVSINEWTWENGDTIPDTKAVFGIKGVPSPNNQPGARGTSVGWSANDGNFYIFGGFGYAFNQGNLNDMWRYDPNINQWTWVKGERTTDNPGVYGTIGVPSQTNTPGSRYFSSGSKDHEGNLWLFGGHQDLSYTARFNDLWKYNVISNEWTFVKGDVTANSAGVFGTIGIADTANKPSARENMKIWIDTANNVWMYGGRIGPNSNIQYLSDTWKFTPDTLLLPVHLLSFTAKVVGETIPLLWNVENEYNFDRYELERRSPGTAFNKIGVLKATNKKTYTYTDDPKKLVESDFYYRLKLIDKDDRYSYSKIVKVKVVKGRNFMLYPNPAKTQVQIQFDKLITDNLTIQISDFAGKIVRSKAVRPNSSNFTLSTASLPAGSYTLKVRKGQEQYIQKLVIVN